MIRRLIILLLIVGCDNFDKEKFITDFLNEVLIHSYKTIELKAIYTTAKINKANQTSWAEKWTKNFNQSDSLLNQITLEIYNISTLYCEINVCNALFNFSTDDNNIVKPSKLYDELPILMDFQITKTVDNRVWALLKFDEVIEVEVIFTVDSKTKKISKVYISTFLT